MNNTNNQLYFECDNIASCTFKELPKKVTFNLSEVTETERMENDYNCRHFAHDEEEEEYKEYQHKDELQFVDYDKNDLMLEAENYRCEQMQLLMDKECWTSENLQYMIYELQEDNFKLKQQLDEELSLSCSISQQHEKAVNDVRRLKNIEEEMTTKLDDANDRGLQFAEKVSELQNELGDTQETLDFILNELKTTRDLKSLKESIDTFFREQEERYA